MSYRVDYVPAQEHMLPYRVLFEEMLECGYGERTSHGETFVAVVAKAFLDHPDGGKPQPVITDVDSARKALCDRIERVEQEYRTLAESKAELRYRRSDEDRPNSLERPLLQVLHRVERTALCLSGGGIRSASLSLGVMQALARFRDATPGAHPDDLKMTSALEEFDYLSTVSGGGYIGSWLMAWSHRLSGEARKPADPPVGQDADADRAKRAAAFGSDAASKASEADAPPRTPGEAFHDTVRSFAGDVRHTSADPEQRPVRHLREYTSFLAPKVGFTLDTFALLAIVLRNLFVNFVMIVPILFAAAAGLQGLRLLQFTHLGVVPPVASGVLWWSLLTVLFLLAGITAGKRLPSSAADPDTQSEAPGQPAAASGATAFAEPTASAQPGEQSTATPPNTALVESETWVLALFVLPLFLASQILIRIWLDLSLSGWDGSWRRLLLGLSAVGALGLLSICTVRVWRRSQRKPQGAAERSELVKYALSGVAVSVLVSILLALALYGVGQGGHSLLAHRAERAAQAANRPPTTTRQTLLGVGIAVEGDHVNVETTPPLLLTPAAKPRWHFALDEHYPGLEAVFAFPVVWVLVMLASSLFSALLGRFEEDVDREWWARAGGLMMGILLVWTVGVGLAVVSPALAQSTHSFLQGLSVASVVLGLLGALGGSSTAGAVGASAAKKANLSGLGRFLNKHDLLLPTLCGAALLCGMIVIAAGEWDLAAWLQHQPFSRVQRMTPFWLHLLLFAAFSLGALLINAVININLFSLHGMYRMRLMRAFLGASNLRRRPNAFTGFDSSDDIHQGAIRCGQGAPLHVVNTTVNLVGTTNSAWRQRKAEGFTVTPLHAGGWRLGYTRTGCYGGPHGLSLATAMAISGAAFNPNMGYHSSPLVTLIMTLFNVRLGWWLPNPKHAASLAGSPTDMATIPSAVAPPSPRSTFLARRSPALALLPLLQEAFGGTNDEGKYIELTDGGHFENLGLYEMVLRRVQWIVVVDGAADPRCELEDLGNAIRKIQIDLGIPIIFRDHPIRMQAGTHGDNLYCALAEIRYGITDYVKEPAVGHLLYLKAGLNGTEPPDIVQYARTHATFPHESTANQFFTESQFESYRHLGHHEAMTLLRYAHRTRMHRDKPLLRALFDAAERYTTQTPTQTPAQPVAAAAQDAPPFLRRNQRAEPRRSAR